MKKKKENKYAGKYVIAFDTICDGNNCVMTEEKGKSVPALYDSFDEAFKEIFEDALSTLQNKTAKELREDYDGAITKALVKRMQEAYDTGNIELMKIFLDANPECNENSEWPEKADEFIMNRKTIFTGKGVQITGTKLK